MRAGAFHPVAPDFDRTEGASGPQPHAHMTTHSVLVNRAPVLTLWGAVVAERLGHPRDTALTLGRAVAGLNAQSKGRRLGIFEPEAAAPSARKSAKARPPARASVELLGRAVPVVRTPAGIRAVAKEAPESPEAVERYLTQKFGSALSDVEAAMHALAQAYPPKRLAAIGFELYEQFRPVIPEGTRGWGAKGRLDLDTIRALADEA